MSYLFRNLSFSHYINHLTPQRQKFIEGGHTAAGTFCG
ncbi:hypothetical protein Pan110_53480 [Gimesia panareensis]|nr:hypothetical protein Pan110_53480 [Gimesia panareensis]